MKRGLKIVVGVVCVILVLCVLGGVVFVFTLGPLVRRAAPLVSRQMFGAELTMDSCKVNPFTTYLKITGLKLRNPPGFQREFMLSAPLIEADFEIWDYLRHHQIRFKTLAVSVAEFNFERKADGSSNFDVFLKQAGQAPEPQPGTTPDAKKGEAAGLMIDQLNLTLRDVYVEDAKNPLLGDMHVDLGLQDREFRNLDSTGKIVQVATTEIVPAIVLAQAGQLGGTVGKSAGKVLGGTAEAGKSVLGGVTGGGKSLLGKLKK